eukprot:667233-Prymnesium_polylepis.1
MDATPAELKKGPGNIYKQIAVALKGAAWRKTGLVNLATGLAGRIEQAAGSEAPVKSKTMMMSMSKTRSPDAGAVSSC